MDQRKRTDNRNNPAKNTNPDPITGTPGAHPVGTGVGAAAGGAAGVGAAAATGAAMGTPAGPVGSAVGAVVGGVVGGLASKGIAEHINPTAEDAYWREHHARQSYADRNYQYDDYAPAYRTGYEGYGRLASTGRSFDECEPELQQDYERNRGTSKLPWEKARVASRAAWNKFDSNLERYLDYDVVDRDLEKIGTLQCIWSDHAGEPAFIGVHTGWIFGRTHVVPAQGVDVNEVQRHIRLPYSVQKVKEAPSYDESDDMTEKMENEVYRYYGVGSQSAQPAPATEAAESATHSEHLHHAGTPTPEQATIQLSEEQLKIGKRQVEAGGVRLRKVVRTEIVNQPVEVRREEVIIERVPASEAHSGRQRAFNEQEVYIPLRREEVVVQKEARLKEEVRARKHTQSDQQTVSEQVRSEDVEIEETGGAQRNYPKGEAPARGMREREEKPRSARLNRE